MTLVPDPAEPSPPNPRLNGSAVLTAKTGGSPTADATETSAAADFGRKLTLAEPGMRPGCRPGPAASLGANAPAGAPADRSPVVSESAPRSLSSRSSTACGVELPSSGAG